MIVLLVVAAVVAAVVVGAPLGAAVLVSVASHHEDFAHTLAGRPPGMLAAAARRLLCLRIGGTAYPRRATTLRYRRADREFSGPASRVSGVPGGGAPVRTFTLPRS